MSECVGGSNEDVADGVAAVGCDWMCRTGDRLGRGAGPALADPASPPQAPAGQTQEVDAAAKKLMAANGLFQRGLFKLAAQEYQDFLTQYPQHASATAARYALGLCQYRLGEHGKAIELLAPVLADSKFEQKDEALAVLGYCELSLKHYEKALADFDALVQQFPSSKHAETAALYRAQALYLANQPKPAVEAADAFLQRYPQSAQRPAAMYFKALGQRGLGQDEQVVQTLAELTRRLSRFPLPGRCPVAVGAGAGSPGETRCRY